MSSWKTLLIALLVILIISLLVSVVPSEPAPTAWPTPTPEIVLYSVRVTVTNLNVRSGPGTQFEITRQVHEGDILLVLDETNGWFQTELGDWVLSDYVEEVNE